MPTNTWIAAAAGDANVDSNWSLGHYPQAGEDIRFTSVSNNNCNWNIDVACSVTLVGYTGILNLANALTNIVTIDQQDNYGYINPNVKAVTASGNITIKRLNTNPFGVMTMTGDGTTFYYMGSWAASGLVCNGNVTVTRLMAYALTTAEEKKATLFGAGGTFNVSLSGSGSYNIWNYGQIDGDGTLVLQVRAAKTMSNIGDISCPVRFAAYASSSASYVATLGANTRFKSSLQVDGLDNSTYGVSLTTSAYTLTVDGLLIISTRGTVNGNYPQSYGGLVINGGSLNNANPIRIGASGLNMSSGSITSDGYSYITCAGDWIISGGSPETWDLFIEMAADGSTYNTTNAMYAGRLLINADVTYSSSTSYIRQLEVAAAKKLHISGGCALVMYRSASGSLAFVNGGTIDGLGTLRFYQRYDASLYVALGDVRVSVVEFRLHASTPPGAFTVFMAEDAETESNIVVTSDAAFPLTLDFNDHDVAFNSIYTTNARSYIKGGSGRLSYLGRDIYGPAWQTYLGQWDAETCTVIKAGTGMEALGAGQVFYDLIAEVEPLNLATDITISHVYRHARAAVLNGYALTVARRDLEEDIFVDTSTHAGSISSTSTLSGSTYSATSLSGRSDSSSNLEGN